MKLKDIFQIANVRSTHLQALKLLWLPKLNQKTKKRKSLMTVIRMFNLKRKLWRLETREMLIAAQMKKWLMKVKRNQLRKQQRKLRRKQQRKQPQLPHLRSTQIAEPSKKQSNRRRQKLQLPKSWQRRKICFKRRKANEPCLIKNYVDLNLGLFCLKNGFCIISLFEYWNQTLLLLKKCREDFPCAQPRLLATCLCCSLLWSLGLSIMLTFI